MDVLPTEHHLIDPTPSHQTQVTPLLNSISTSNMQSYLTTLTNFNNRYYTASTGAQASTWIQTTLKSVCISPITRIDANN